jgi:hypothetical protein
MKQSDAVSAAAVEAIERFRPLLGEGVRLWKDDGVIKVITASNAMLGTIEGVSFKQCRKALAAMPSIPHMHCTKGLVQILRA